MQHLVDSLNQYANWLLSGVVNEETRGTYLADIRRIGSGLLENATNPVALEHWAASKSFTSERSNPPRPDGILSHLPELIHPCVLRFEAAYDSWNIKALRQLHTRAEPTPAGDTSEPVMSIPVEKPTDTGSPSGVDPLSVVGLSWDDVEITFVSDVMIHIRVRGRAVASRTAAQMGLVDTRKTKRMGYKLGWTILLAMSQTNGRFHSGDAGGLAGIKWLTAYKHIGELTKIFKEMFAIPADPFPYVDNEGYQAAFTINRSSADFAADLAALEAGKLFDDSRPREDGLSYDDIQALRNIK